MSTTALLELPASVYWAGYTGQWRPNGTRAEVWTYGDGYAYVFEIETRAALRGRGRGSALLAAICQAADEAGITLVLLPLADDPGDEVRLRAWYARHGFVALPVNGLGHVGMQRVPRSGERRGERGV